MASLAWFKGQTVIAAVAVFVIESSVSELWVMGHPNVLTDWKDHNTFTNILPITLLEKKNSQLKNCVKKICYHLFVEAGDAFYDVK